MLTVYRLFLYFIFPIIACLLGIKAFRNPRFRSRFWQRFGFQTPVIQPDGVWLHAVSVGEVNAAVPLIEYFLKAHPGKAILVTTMTTTGADRVSSLFGEKVIHCYLPYDYPGSVNRFFRRVQPALAVVMETEIWPNLIRSCANRRIPMVYVNVRLSARSYEKYRKFRSIVSGSLGEVKKFAVQTQVEAERLVSLGASLDTVEVTGNLKFDMKIPEDIHQRGELIRQDLGAERLIWVAGSTHEHEESQVIDAFRKAKIAIPNLLLILVPRHPERFDSVANLCEEAKLNMVRRSEINRSVGDGTDVYLCDTMGELTLMMAASDVAFVGGSLVPVGGHNLLEANALEIPVVFGPHMFNFEEISQLVLNAEAGLQVRDSRELGETIIKLLENHLQRTHLGLQGKTLVQANRGALKKVCDLLEQQLNV